MTKFASRLATSTKGRWLYGLAAVPLLIAVTLLAGPRLPETRVCPHCGGRIVRKPLRALDRAVGKISPIQRIACMKCRWSGRVRVTAAAQRRNVL